MIKDRIVWLFTTIVLLPVMADASDEQITYANQVSRIIQDNCVVCHQPGAIGPMSFTSYDEVRPWAPLIRLKVLEREMPPYHYDHDVGIQELKNDWRLSDKDINTITTWVESGSPLGNTEDLRLGADPNIFQNLKDSSAAAETTVLPSGLHAKLSMR